MSQNLSQNIEKDTERYGISSKTRVLEKRQNPTKQWDFWRFPKIVAEAEGEYTTQYAVFYSVIAPLYIVYFCSMSHYYHSCAHGLTS